MSSSFDCKCEERKKPIELRNWGVSKRMFNTSAFNGYHRTHSNYSTVHCLSCRAVGRTKANYVMRLKDIVLSKGHYAFKDQVPDISDER